MKRNILFILAIAAFLVIGMMMYLKPAPPAETLSSDASWQAFAQEVAELGKLIEDAPVASDGRTRAEGYRSIARLLSTSLANFTDYNRAEYPNFFRFPNQVARIGWDNPDNVYYTAPLRGDHDYRIRGNLGTAKFSSFMVYSGIIGYTPITDMRMITGTNSQNINIEENGDFEVYLSAKPHDGNWLQLEPDANNIIIRQLFDDWENAQSGWLEIINLTTLNQPPAPLTGNDLQEQLLSATKLVSGIRQTLTLATRVLFSVKIGDNELLAPKPGRLAMTDPSQVTALGHFKLEPNQALITTFAKTDCAFTNIQLANAWQESLDYTNHQSHLNSHSTHVDTDNQIRYVIAAKDPGVPNWLDTTGLSEGSIFARWTHCEKHPDTVSNQVVDLSSLRKHLPADTPYVSATERTKAIHIRKQSMSRRYAGG